MSMICRFFLLTVNSKGIPSLKSTGVGVGRWSVMGKNLVDVGKERPPDYGSSCRKNLVQFRQCSVID